MARAMIGAAIIAFAIGALTATIVALGTVLSTTHLPYLRHWHHLPCLRHHLFRTPRLLNASANLESYRGTVQPWSQYSITQTTTLGLMSTRSVFVRQTLVGTTCTLSAIHKGVRAKASTARSMRFASLRAKHYAKQYSKTLSRRL